MSDDQLKADIKAWAGRMGDDPCALLALKADIERAYYQVMGRTLRKCNCKDILTDAVAEMYRHLKQGLPMAKDVKCELKAGAIICYGGEVYSRHNITDEVAVKALQEQPEYERLFAILPDMPEKDGKAASTDTVAEDAQLAEKPKKSAKKAKRTTKR